MVFSAEGASNRRKEPLYACGRSGRRILLLNEGKEAHETTA